MSTMEHRKWEQIKVTIVKTVRFLRDHYTLPFGFGSLFNFRLWQERNRWLSRLLFGAVQVNFVAGQALGIKVYLAMLDGTFDWQAAGLLKYFYHSIKLLTGSESSNLLLASLILMPPNFNLINYTLYPFLEHYRDELADMVTIERQIKTYDAEQDSRITEQIGRQISLCFNPHMTGSEKIAFVEAFHRMIVRSYLLSMRMNLNLISGMFFVLVYYFTFLLPDHTLDIPALGFVFLAYLSGLSLTVFSVSLSTILGYFSTMLIYGTALSWRRFCGTIRRMDTRTDGQFQALYARLRHGQRAYMNCVSVFQKVNHYMLDMVFYVSATLTFVSQIQLMIELFANRLKATVQTLVITLIIFEFMLIFLPVFHLLMTSKRLYAVNGLLLSYQAKFAGHRFRNRLRAFKTRALLRLSLFGEVIHSRKRFEFCMSLGIGRINSKAIVKFLSIYTSFLFMLIPMVVYQKSLL